MILLEVHFKPMNVGKFKRAQVTGKRLFLVREVDGVVMFFLFRHTFEDTVTLQAKRNRGLVSAFHMLVKQEDVAPDLLARRTVEAFTNFPEAVCLFDVLDFDSRRFWLRFRPFAGN